MEIGGDETLLEYITEDCPVCGGSGFSGGGTMYDGVCDTCGGMGEVVTGIKKKMNKKPPAMEASVDPIFNTGPAAMQRYNRTGWGLSGGRQSFTRHHENIITN